MVDSETLASILRNLRSNLEKLHILAALPQDMFLQSFTNVESAKLMLCHMAGVH